MQPIVKLGKISLERVLNPSLFKLISMKKIFLFLLICYSINCFSQKNEIVTYLGKSSNQLFYQLGDVIQLKYERNIIKTLSIQTGFRYHDELYWRSSIYDESSLRINSTFNSYKFDLSVLFIPINGQHFKFKSGFGLDAGKSLYTLATEGYAIDIETKDGIDMKEYWKYSIKEITDFGVHFIFSGSYYFKNNLLCTVQAMYNRVFNEEEYSPEILRISPVSLSIGIGHRF